MMRLSYMIRVTLQPKFVSVQGDETPAATKSLANATRSGRLLLHDSRMHCRSCHAVLGIFDPSVKISRSCFTVERHGEIAECIGGMRGPVVHRVRLQGLKLVVIFGPV